MAAATRSRPAGGREGRWAGFLILVASLLTIPATRLGQYWQGTKCFITPVDFALLAGLYILCLFSRRYFPIWTTNFHLRVVLINLNTALVPQLGPSIYRALESFLAIPITLVMMWGIHLDRAVKDAPHKVGDC